MGRRTTCVLSSSVVNFQVDKLSSSLMFIFYLFSCLLETVPIISVIKKKKVLEESSRILLHGTAKVLYIVHSLENSSAAGLNY